MIIIKKFFVSYFIIIIFFIIFSSLFLYYYNYNLNIFTISRNSNYEYYFTSNNFIWPLPGYHTITSYFGPRTSPTTGASFNHSGIDIAAPENTQILSITDGFVIFTGFNGANGHSIIIKNNEFEINYCHVSANYIVNIGNNIQSGQLIGYVGPKYLSSGNSFYTDSNGRFTNGATTGCHLHLTIKKDGIAVNPLSYFK